MTLAELKAVAEAAKGTDILSERNHTFINTFTPELCLKLVDSWDALREFVNDEDANHPMWPEMAAADEAVEHYLHAHLERTEP